MPMNAGLHKPPTGKSGHDAPHGVYDSVGKVQASTQPRCNPPSALQALFASQLATMMTDYSARNSFDRLLVIAPDALLAILRKMIKPEMQEGIVAEIDKDMALVPNVQIES